MLLVVQYSYSDKASCTSKSLTKFTASPLNTLCKTNAEGSSSYKHICSDGVYQTLQYSDAKCSNLFVTNSMSPTGCQGGYVQKCVAGPAPAPTPPAPIPPSPIISTFDISHQVYANNDCTGTILQTVGGVKNVCVAEGKGSYKFTCDNNIPTRNEYNSSTTCSGKASLSQLMTTCSAMSR